ncbi:MAG: hypothetical protein K9M36_01045 [Candidatus Pacebacteria bacterium]|nr:hypothetical protein [Candidatus Paceibacterota bacterium]
MKKKSLQYNQGAALITSVIVFMFTSLAVVAGVVQPAVKDFRTATVFAESRTTHVLVDSLVEDAMHRLRHGIPLASETTTELPQGSVTISVSDVGSNAKEITAHTTVGVHERRSQMQLTTAEGVSFFYGVQTGQGGMLLSGSSGIVGNVYAHGDIVGTGSSTYVTGSAVAANSSALSTDVENGSSGTPPHIITFGQSSGTQDMAQSFQLSESSPLYKASLYIKKIGTPGNLTVRILKDSSGSPGAVQVASGTIASSLVTNSFAWVDVVFTTHPTLNVGETYWLVVDGGNHNSRYYEVGANLNSFTGGSAKRGQHSSTWNVLSPNVDAYFQIYVGGLTSTITGPSQWNRLSVGTSGSGIAHAHTVNYTSATDEIYCTTGTGNNKTCDTSRPDPEPIGWPVSPGNIISWQEEAESGGTTSGNFTLSGSGTTSLGPQKITGNVSVGGSTILNVTGTLWIQGDLTVNGSGRVRLDSSYGSGSGVIVVDGRVTIAGSSPVTGSGTAGSYIMVVSNSDCPTSSTCGSSNAIDISGAAGAVILVAQNGTINFSGSASARQATGYQIKLSGATTVTYEEGIANLDFSSGPSATWGISSWKEIE